MRYIGETKRILKFRLVDHRGYITNQDIAKVTGEYFNTAGHILADISIMFMEKVRSNDDLYRKEREKYFIRNFNTFYKGLKLQP
jgi:hypothetical protein